MSQVKLLFITDDWFSRSISLFVIVRRAGSSSELGLVLLVPGSLADESREPSPAYQTHSLQFAFGLWVLPSSCPWVAFVTLLPFSFALVVSSAFRRDGLDQLCLFLCRLFLSLSREGTLAVVVPCTATVPIQALVTDCSKNQTQLVKA